MILEKVPKDKYEEELIRLMAENSGGFRSVDKATISKNQTRERTVSAYTNWAYLQALLSKKMYLEYFMTSMEFIVVRFT